MVYISLSVGNAKVQVSEWLGAIAIIGLLQSYPLMKPRLLRCPFLVFSYAFPGKSAGCCRLTFLPNQPPPQMSVHSDIWYLTHHVYHPLIYMHVKSLLLSATYDVHDMKSWKLCKAVYTACDYIICTLVNGYPCTCSSQTRTYTRFTVAVWHPPIAPQFTAGFLCIVA